MNNWILKVTFFATPEARWWMRDARIPDGWPVLCVLRRGSRGERGATPLSDAEVIEMAARQFEAIVRPRLPEIRSILVTPTIWRETKLLREGIISACGDADKLDMRYDGLAAHWEFEGEDKANRIYSPAIHHRRIDCR